MSDCLNVLLFCHKGCSLVYPKRICQCANDVFALFEHVLGKNITAVGCTLTHEGHLGT